jgi:outer membrane receptor protein involved in Fe transport
LFGFNGGQAVDFDIGRFTLPVSLKETAAYADATYYFTPTLDATLGIRVSRNRQTFEQLGTGLLGSSNPGGASSDTVSTYLATVRYHLADGGILYARAASGYRPGGPNLVAFAPGTDEIIGDPTYEADTLWNYEIGAKLKPARWLTLDGSVFYIDWQNIQLFRTENGLSVVGNGDDATSKGAEISFAARALPGWTVEGSMAYTDATLKDAAPDLGGRAGERLPHVPRWSSVITTSYNFALSEETEGHVSAQWRFVGRREATFDASGSGPQYALPSYHSFDLRAGVEHAGWNVDLYLRNAFDRRGQAAADLGSTGFGYPAAVTVIQPRTLGLVVTRDF